MPEQRISQSLYELGDSLQKMILEHVDPDTGELDSLFEADLLKLEGDWEQKCIQVALYAKGLITEGDATKAVAQIVLDRASRDRARAEVLYRQADRIMNYLDAQLQRMEINEIKDPAVRIHYRASSAIVIDHPEDVPAALMNDPKPLEPSKTKIKEAMKNKRVEEIYPLIEGSEPGTLVDDIDAEPFAHIERRKTLKLS